MQSRQTCRVLFSAPQDKRLEELWERFSGRPGAAEGIAAALDAGFGRAAVAARLRALGLRRGVLTTGQVRAAMRELPACDAVNS